MQALQFHPQLLEPVSNIVDSITVPNWIIDDLDKTNDLINDVSSRVIDAIMSVIAHLPFGDKLI